MIRLFSSPQFPFSLSVPQKRNARRTHRKEVRGRRRPAAFPPPPFFFPPFLLPPFLPSGTYNVGLSTFRREGSQCTRVEARRLLTTVFLSPPPFFPSPPFFLSSSLDARAASRHEGISEEDEWSYSFFSFSFPPPLYPLPLVYGTPIRVAVPSIAKVDESLGLGGVFPLSLFLLFLSLSSFFPRCAAVKKERDPLFFLFLLLFSTESARQQRIIGRGI